jgi:citrate lyase subunit beta/citryl-CoA lyase
MFTPTSEQLSGAQDLLDRMNMAIQEGSGVALDANGRMIDEASARSARRVLELGQASR